jgi:hypothetical protein
MGFGHVLGSVGLPMNSNPSYMISRITTVKTVWDHPTPVCLHSLARVGETSVSITSFCGNNAWSLRGLKCLKCLKCLKMRTRSTAGPHAQASHHDSCSMHAPRIPLMQNGLLFPLNYQTSYLTSRLFSNSTLPPSRLPTKPMLVHTRRITHRPGNQSKTREQPNIDRVTPSSSSENETECDPGTAHDEDIMACQGLPISL